jgi:peptidyl-prolyl cis-trans isomerase B (cyclophilin B)
MSKRTRERQLAKLAARRQAQRDASRRRREILLTVVIVIVVVGLLAGGGLFLLGGGEEASNSPSPSPTPSAGPGTQTGTVQPEPAPNQVACGAEVPAGAGKPKPQFTSGTPPMKIDPERSYLVTLRTSCGNIVLQLNPRRAPQTVNSFVFLARQGYFDGQYVTRLDTGIDVIQAGDPTGTGTGGPGYSIPDELRGDEEYGPGVLAMANAGPNTGGSQFFIVTGPDGHNLDGSPNYTIFGRVREGIDVARRIQLLPIRDPDAGITGQQPKKAIYIDRAIVETVKPEA